MIVLLGLVWSAFLVDEGDWRMKMSHPRSTEARRRRPQTHPSARALAHPTETDGLGTMALVLFALGMIASIWLS
ncbi:MAG: hypothetical protein CMJ28_01395 [Phycisphaerae bacterium]|nr:hypothetical protein [Phycisphaerae bacterium]